MDLRRGADVKCACGAPTRVSLSGKTRKECAACAIGNSSYLRGARIAAIEKTQQRWIATYLEKYRAGDLDQLWRMPRDPSTSQWKFRQPPVRQSIKLKAIAEDITQEMRASPGGMSQSEIRNRLQRRGISVTIEEIQNATKWGVKKSLLQKIDRAKYDLPSREHVSSAV